MKKVHRFLDSLNPHKVEHRAKARAQLETLEAAMLAECRSPYTTAQMVLRSEVRALPIQLRAYRELHEYIQMWLY